MKLVQKSFEKNCISNAWDGAEDYVIWADSSPFASEDSSSREENTCKYLQFICKYYKFI